MTGRGAWPISGAGGTLRVDGKSPGSYYCLADGPAQVGAGGWVSPDPNVRAVRAAVLAIQRALNREDNATLLTDGVFGPFTRAAVLAWQRKQPASANTGVWGGIGPDSSKALFMPLLRRTSTTELAYVVCGLIGQESTWDPGAVGYIDPDDLGLAQINGNAHPDLSERERLQPATAFRFVHDRLTAALVTFDGDLRTAVASYNLGSGGTRLWVRAGSPDVWTPEGSIRPRNVAAYIDTILTACK